MQLLHKLATMSSSNSSGSTYQSKFISVVDAHAIVDELCQEKIIDEDLAERIRKETEKDADGGHL